MNLKNTIENIEKNGFKVNYFETKEEAADYIASELSGKTIGIGGSKTIEVMGLYEKLSEKNEVFWHWKQNPAEAREKAANAEVYLTSANAVAETGEIVNIDGNGNRVASMLYGHEKLMVIFGTNKIEETLEKAIYRARNIASPLNARRFQTKTPCVMSEPMKCHDCNSPERICRGMSILMKKMNGIAENEVIIIGEELGY